MPVALKFSFSCLFVFYLLSLWIFFSLDPCVVPLSEFNATICNYIFKYLHVNGKISRWPYRLIIHLLNQSLLFVILLAISPFCWINISRDPRSVNLNVHRWTFKSSRLVCEAFLPTFLIEMISLQMTTTRWYWL